MSDGKIFVRTRLASAVASMVIGFGMVVVLHRGVPSALVGSADAEPLQLLVGLWVVTFMATVLLLKRVPYPDVWGVISLLGGLWAVTSSVLHNMHAPAGSYLLVLVVAILGSFFSVLAPAVRRDMLMWLPAFLYLSVVFGRTIFEGPLPGGFFGKLTGSIAFGHLMVLGVLVTYFLSQRLPEFRNLVFAAGSVFIVGVMLSGSRGALVGLIVAVILIIAKAFVRAGRFGSLLEIRRFGLLGMCAAPFFLMGSTISRKVSESFRLSEQVDTVQIPVYSAGRFQIWSSALQEFDSFNDFLVGKGQSTIRINSSVDYPHNLLLELLLIGGLITVVPFVLFLISLFRRMFRPVYEGRFDFFVAAAVTGVFSMFSGDLSYNVVFFFFLGLAYGQVLKQTGRTIKLRISKSGASD